MPNSIDQTNTQFFHFHNEEAPFELRCRKKLTNFTLAYLMYHPDNNNTEYIEIKNIGSSSFNLQGVEISGIGYQFDDSDSNLSPDDILLIVKEDPATFRNNYS